MQLQRVSSVTLGILSTLGCAIFAYAMYRYSANITGPFVFGDETAYMDMARDLHTGADFSRWRQYGPLYPFVVSWFFAFGDIWQTYQATRLFNIAIFASIAVPVFLLARELLPGSPLRFFAPVFVVAMPFGAFNYVVWAEPMFYPFVAWMFYFVYRQARDASRAWAVMAGAAIGCVFLLKPIGIVFIIAAAMMLAAEGWLAGPQHRTRVLLRAAWVLAAMTAFAAPWIVRNLLTPGTGPLGYANVFDVARSRLDEIGWSGVVFETLISVFYQLSYIQFGTWGMAVLLVVGVAVFWRVLDGGVRWLAVFLLLSLAGTIALSAFHMVAYGGNYWLPNGRYYVAYFATIMLLAVHLLSRLDWRGRPLKIAAASALAWSVSIALASPLDVVTASSLMNNPEMAVMIRLLQGGQILWQSRYDPSLVQALALAGSVFSLSVVLVLASRRRAVLGCVLAGIFVLNYFVGRDQHRYIKIMAMTQAAFNNIARIAAPRERSESLAYDATLSATSFSFIREFWTGRTDIQYVHASDLLGGKRFTVIPPAAIPQPGTFALPVQAGPASYRQLQEHYDGFAPGTPLAGAVCGQGPAARGVISGNADAVFYVNLAPGEYRVDFNANLEACPGMNSARFKLSWPGFAATFGSESGLVLAASTTLRHAGGDLQLHLQPARDSKWAFQALTFASATRRDPPKLFVSPQTLPLPLVQSSTNLHLYSVPGQSRAASR